MKRPPFFIVMVGNLAMRALKSYSSATTTINLLMETDNPAMTLSNVLLHSGNQGFNEVVNPVSGNDQAKLLQTRNYLRSGACIDFINQIFHIHEGFAFHDFLNTTFEPTVFVMFEYVSQQAAINFFVCIQMDVFPVCMEVQIIFFCNKSQGFLRVK